jgi:hypothetical protein
MNPNSNSNEEEMMTMTITKKEWEGILRKRTVEKKAREALAGVKAALAEAEAKKEAEKAEYGEDRSLTLTLNAYVLKRGEFVFESYEDFKARFPKHKMTKKDWNDACDNQDEFNYDLNDNWDAIDQDDDDWFNRGDILRGIFEWDEDQKEEKGEFKEDEE